MKRSFGALITLAGFLGVVSVVVAVETRQVHLPVLLQTLLPNWSIKTNTVGEAEALLSQSGERLDLTQVKKENPSPSRLKTVGLWFSPGMDWIARQRLKVSTAQDAMNVVRLWHMLWRGEEFEKQKLYEARKFEGDWVVTVEHDHTNYPGNVLVTSPYELVLDTNGVLQNFRQRCFSYPGSARVYTNTVQTVYEREIRLNRGHNYPEALFKELHEAWEKEKAN